MREVKYQAFVEDERIINVTRITFAGSVLYVMSDDDEDDGYEFQIEPDNLRQFIGLQDVDKKDIYRGDIVQVYYVYTRDVKNTDIKKGDEQKQGYPIEVIEDEDGSGFWPFINGCGGCTGYAQIAINHSNGFGSDEYGYYIVRVIGNKFQNQELLERK